MKEPAVLTDLIIKTWPNGQKSVALAALRFCLGDDADLRLAQPSPRQTTADDTAQAAATSGLRLSPGQVPGQRYLVEYTPYAQTAVARFEQALAQAPKQAPGQDTVQDTVQDTAAGFARFASEDFTRYTAFLNHWVRSDFVQDQIVLNLADLYDNPAAWLHWVLGMLTPAQPPTPDQLDRITQAAPKWLAAQPLPDLRTFRHYDATLFDRLDRLTLRRDVVLQIFHEVMGRDLEETNILHFQAVASPEALRNALLPLREHLAQKGQTEQTAVKNPATSTTVLSSQEITIGYLLLLGRNPSSDEIQRMGSKVSDLTNMRKIIVGSPEFTKKYENLFRPKTAASAIRSLHGTKRDGHESLLPLDSERIVFLHIPKCGGTTLHNVLALWYGENQMHAERFNGLYNHDATGLGSKQVFSGHFDFYSTSFIPGPKRFISVLRDPTDRLISLYNFHRAHGDKIIEQNNLQHARWANEYDIDSYFAQPMIRAHHAINNSLVRHFSSIPQIANRLLAPSMQSVSLDEMFDQAIENLSKFAFIGFMDQYESDVVRLAGVLGKTPPVQLQKHQVLDELMTTNLAMKRIEKQRPSLASLDAIEELIEYDRKFYAHARALFAR